MQGCSAVGGFEREPSEEPKDDAEGDRGHCDLGTRGRCEIVQAGIGKRHIHSIGPAAVAGPVILAVALPMLTWMAVLPITGMLRVGSGCGRVIAVPGRGRIVFRMILGGATIALMAGSGGATVTVVAITRRPFMAVAGAVPVTIAAIPGSIPVTIVAIPRSIPARARFPSTRRAEVDSESEGSIGGSRFGPPSGRRVDHEIASRWPESDLRPQGVPPDVRLSVIESSSTFVVDLGRGGRIERLGELDEDLARRLVLEIALIGPAVLERRSSFLCAGGADHPQGDHQGGEDRQKLVHLSKGRISPPISQTDPSRDRGRGWRSRLAPIPRHSPK